MKVFVNGQERSMSDGASISKLVDGETTDGHHRGIAVALNGEVVPRAAWEATSIADGDKIEILHAIGGG